MVYLILSFPFLHESDMGANTLVLGIPLSSSDGSNVLGMIALILLAASLILLAASLEKYHGRLVFAGIILAALLPQFLAKSYQKTFATGLYAISYEQEASECDIDRTNDQTVMAECELILINHSGDDVAFSVEIYDRFSHAERSMVEDIVYHIVPYDVRLLGNERKTVRINTEMNLSKTENPIEGGNMKLMNLIIRSDGKERGL